MRKEQLVILRALAAAPEGLNTMRLADATERSHFSARRGAASLARDGFVAATETSARQSRLAWHWTITVLGRRLLEAEEQTPAPSQECSAAPTLMGVNSIFNWRG